MILNPASLLQRDTTCNRSQSSLWTCNTVSERHQWVAQIGAILRERREGGLARLVIFGGDFTDYSSRVFLAWMGTNKKQVGGAESAFARRRKPNFPYFSFQTWMLCSLSQVQHRGNVKWGCVCGSSQACVLFFSFLFVLLPPGRLLFPFVLPVRSPVTRWATRRRRRWPRTGRGSLASCCCRCWGSRWLGGRLHTGLMERGRVQRTAACQGTGSVHLNSNYVSGK